MAGEPRSSLQIYVNLFEEGNGDSQSDRTEGENEVEGETSQADDFVKVSLPPITDGDPDGEQTYQGSAGENKVESHFRSPTKLCGYLRKCKVESRLKQYRKRWFVFVDRSCKLLYYRTPQDMIPLGEIDIACASLSFCVDLPRENVFQIRYGVCLKCVDCSKENNGNVSNWQGKWKYSNR